MSHWTNWSGGVVCTPQRIATPASEAEVIDLVRRAARTGAPVRVAGSGHSFTPLCATAGLLLSLDALQGVVEVDHAAGEATVWAGSKLYALGDPLWQHGLAMTNLGDIDRQSLAGAISTGTHGTGHTLGNLSTQVAALRLVTASGELIDCSPTQEPDLLPAAALSLGSLGVITRITLRLLPAYYLHERSWVASFEETLAGLEELVTANRHFEFFWTPQEDRCAIKTLNPVELTPEDEALTPIDLGWATGDQVSGRLARYVRTQRIDRSYRILPSERTLKFNESEYAVPAANGPACLAELRQMMRSRHPNVAWPIEYRTLAADELWLSPAYGRATVTISIHQAAELPYGDFFAAAEAIFRNHQGRPHWGKIQTVRRRLDPQGRFLNEHLATLLGK